MRFTGRVGIVAAVGASVVALVGLAWWVAWWVASQARVERPRDAVEVMTAWRGATPEEVERAVTVPVERRLSVLRGVRGVRSESREGVSVVTAVFDGPADEATLAVQGVLREVSSQLPQGADVPVLRQRRAALQQTRWVVQSDVRSRVELSRWVTTALRRALEVQPGVREVELCGAVTERLVVRLDDARLRALGLDVEKVAAADFDVPEDALGDVALGAVKLRDVAQVVRDASVPTCEARLDGVSVIVVTVQHERGATLTLPAAPADVSVTPVSTRLATTLVVEGHAPLPGLALVRGERAEVSVPVQGFPVLRADDAVVVRVVGNDRDALEATLQPFREAMTKSARWVGVWREPPQPERRVEVSEPTRRREVAALLRVVLAGQYVTTTRDGTPVELRLDGTLEDARLADGTPLTAVARITDALQPGVLLRVDGVPALELPVGADRPAVRRVVEATVVPPGVVITVE